MLRLSQPFSARLLLGGLLALSTPITGFAALPLPSSGLPALHIQGSNTIGAKLGPALVSGLLEKEGFSNVRVQESGINEQRVIGQDAQGRLVNIEVAAHGSGTGFTALGQNAAELAASSRPIKDSEAASLATLGDLKSPESEQVIAIDGLAVILHPSNPVQSLSVEQLARVFAGEVKTWEELGGRGGAIRLYARDDNSGTFDTFKELVLSSHGKTLATGAQRFESSNQLSDSVSQDPQGIGFIGLPYIRKAKPLAISAGDSQPMLPSTELVATEDYPLSRRLFFYMKPAESNPGPRPWCASSTARAARKSSPGAASSPRPSRPCRSRRTVTCRRPTTNWPAMRSAWRSTSASPRVVPNWTARPCATCAGWSAT